MTEQALLHQLATEISLEPETPITLETDLVLSGLIDSLGFMTLVQWIEDTYSVTVDLAEIVVENFRTPANIVAFVATLVSPT